jgi:tRNA dimethylallyltransferase
MGPTAAGKTDLAIALAEAAQGELISVDSALVYRGLDIGAAKPDYPHHLVDLRDPADPYSAADFVRDAQSAIADIRERGKAPILVGGTMLYFRALLLGLDDMPASDPAIRAAIEAEAASRGWPALHAELAAVDPKAAARIHVNHSQRISRALEVWRQTGRPMSDWQTGAGPEVALPHLPVVVCPRDRACLHARIAQRFEQMMASGFLEEVRYLHSRGDLTPALPAIRAVGYRQLWEHLDGETDLPAAIQRGLAATRRLAKRQLTWLRSWPGAVWLETDSGGHLLAVRQEGGESMGTEEGLLETVLTIWRNCSPSSSS